MHQYEIYYEPADTDDPRQLLGHVYADTTSDALDQAAQYWETPQHDLVAVQLPEQRPSTLHPQWGNQLYSDFNQWA